MQLVVGIARFHRWGRQDSSSAKSMKSVAPMSHPTHSRLRWPGLEPLRLRLDLAPDAISCEIDPAEADAQLAGCFARGPVPEDLQREQLECFLIAQWFFNETNALAGATSSNLTLVQVQPSQALPGDQWLVTLSKTGPSQFYRLQKP